LAAVPAAGRADRTPAEPAAAAASDLFERYRARIYVYCLHRLGSREEAEDATQTTFMNAFRGLGRGVVPESEQAWLFKIAENVCLSRRRTSWRRGRMESPSDFELIEEVVPSPPRELADELIGLQDALEAMPENQRRAIVLREWQGLSYREIAAELELSQAAVETLIFRARRTLATGLEEPAPAKRHSRALVGSGLNLSSLLPAVKG
jgi:RNA polymerase sigma-70 factor, ECF subfamily